MSRLVSRFLTPALVGAFHPSLPITYVRHPHLHQSASSTSQTIIWAYGTTNPDDNAKDASLTQHPADGSGPLSLDLSAAFDEGGSIANSGGAVSTPLQPFQKMIIAHAILCTIGFLILLPAGALLARYARTFTNAWFGGHWFFQFAFGACADVLCGRVWARALTDVVFFCV